MKRWGFYIAAMFLTVSCTEKGQSGVGGIQVDFEAPAPVWKVEKIVPLETRKETMYNSFFRIRATDRHIFVQDDQKVLVFDTAGHYLSKIEHVGRGPREYIRMSNFWVTGDEVYICDRAIDKVLVYSLNDDFIRSIPVDFRADAIAVFDQFLAFKDAYNQQGTLVVTDKNGKRVYETVSPILAKTTVSIPAIFPFTEAGGQIYYFPDYSSSIYTVGSDTSDVKEIPFDFGVHTLTPEIVSTLTGQNFSEVFDEKELVNFPSFYPTRQWWGMVFSIRENKYSWYYNTESKRQYLLSYESFRGFKPIACATEDCFVASVEAPVFLEDDRFAAYRDKVSVSEEDNAVLIFYTVE